jgi:hypothetical protein
MKKTALFTLFSAFTLVAASGYCDTGVTTTGTAISGPDAARHAHRAEMIAEHKKYPAKEKSGSGTGEETKMSKFWKNEGERSGVNKWSVPSLNPVPWFKEQDRKYKERKAAGK